MSDVIRGGETSQQNEALKHSFKTLKTQAKTLITKGIGGVWQQSLLHRRELRDNGIQISQVKESSFWKQKSPIENTLKSEGLVIKLDRKENKSTKIYFLFEPKEISKGKKDMDLRSIIFDKPAGKNESYKVDFHDDGSIKIIQTDEHGVEIEISAEQFVYLKEIDTIKNTLSKADESVTKTVKAASLFAGTALASAVVGTGIGRAIGHFTELQMLKDAKMPADEVPKSEYQYDPSLVEKLKEADLAIEKIKQVYGVNFDYVTTSYNLLKSAIDGQLDSFLRDYPTLDNNDIKNFFKNTRNDQTENRLKNRTSFFMDPDNKGNIMYKDSEGEVAAFLRSILESFVKRDMSRIKQVLFASNRNGNSDGKGGLMGNNTLATTLGLSGSNFLWDEIKNFFHESSHLTNGLFGNIFELDSAENQNKPLHINGYRSDVIADQSVEWFNVFADNPEFFKKYFFNIQGDGTFNMFKETNTLQRSLNEIMAISCTNYFFNERANWMGDDIKKYPDIERAIRKQLGVSFYGGEFLADFPEGLSDEQLASIRRDFGKNYILGLTDIMSGADDLGETTLKALSEDDLKKYYTKNTSGYLIVDGEPEGETNRRFIEENNLELHISSRPLNLGGIQNLNQINEFIVRYGRTFFPDGKIE